ncbi:hypothetical protein PIB30_068044 [Stylosanthes scabra]|uniref:Uncharacterized protein n=1 Tax=Stylosanthes scabra TaxID=79078 RepID=A0ABU6WMD8_9FABA|nr:hypothetical protein [Stylosanthes scabra]
MHDDLANLRDRALDLDAGRPPRPDELLATRGYTSGGAVTPTKGQFPLTSAKTAHGGNQLVTTGKSSIKYGNNVREKGIPPSDLEERGRSPFLAYQGVGLQGRRCGSREGKHPGWRLGSKPKLRAIEISLGQGANSNGPSRHV